jgi:hypothetical protein
VAFFTLKWNFIKYIKNGTSYETYVWEMYKYTSHYTHTFEKMFKFCQSLRFSRWWRFKSRYSGLWHYMASQARRHPHQFSIFVYKVILVPKPAFRSYSRVPEVTSVQRERFCKWKKKS